MSPIVASAGLVTRLPGFFARQSRKPPVRQTDAHAKSQVADLDSAIAVEVAGPGYARAINLPTALWQPHIY